MSLFDTILLNELNTDPSGLGYAAAGWSNSPPSTSEYEAITSLLNSLTQTKLQDVTGDKLFIAIKPANFLTVFSATGTDAFADQEYIRFLLNLETIPLKSQYVRTALSNIFSGMTETLTNIQNLQYESISRATEIGLRFIRIGDLKRLKGDA